MNTIPAFIQLLRPLNLLLGTLAILIAAVLMPTWPAWHVIGLTVLVVVSYNGAANALNDWFDYAIDQVNRPGRPLVSGALPRLAGVATAMVLFGLGSTAVLFLPVPARIIALALALPVMVLYTPLLKGTPLWGNIAIASMLGSAFLFAGAAFGDLPRFWIPAGLAFGYTIVRELVKDIEDIDGDRTLGMGTFPVRFGVIPAVHLAQALTILLAVGVLLPYIMGIYGVWYLTALILGVELPLIVIIIFLWKHPTPEGCGWAARLLKVDIFFGLLAVLVSKFDA